MKYTYNKLLKILISKYSKTKSRELYDSNLFALYQTDKSFFNAIEVLRSKGLLQCYFDIQDQLYKIELTDYGITYFADKNQDRFRFWVPVIISLVALFRPEIVAFIRNVIKLCS